MKHCRVLFDIFALLLLLPCTSNVIVTTALSEESHDSAIAHNSESHDPESHQQSFRSAESSKDVEELIVGEGFILTALERQQQNQNQKRLNKTEAAPATVTDQDNDISQGDKNNNGSKQISSIFQTHFAVLLPTNAADRKSTFQIYPFPSRQSFLKPHHQLLKSMADSPLVKISPRSLSGTEKKRKKRSPQDETADSENREPVVPEGKAVVLEKDRSTNSQIEVIFPGDYNMPTVASEEVGASQDYSANDDRNSRFQIPLENIVVVGDDAEEDDDVEGDFGDTEYDTEDRATETTVSGNGNDDDEKDTKNDDLGAIRIGKEKFGGNGDNEDKENGDEKPAETLLEEPEKQEKQKHTETRWEPDKPEGRKAKKLPLELPESVEPKKLKPEEPKKELKQPEIPKTRNKLQKLEEPKEELKEPEVQETPKEVQKSKKPKKPQEPEELKELEKISEKEMMDKFDEMRQKDNVLRDETDLVRVF